MTDAYPKHAGAGSRSAWMCLPLLLGWAALGQAETPLPYTGPGKHLGVVTCAGSTCHGAAEPFEDTPVLQNEYITWSREDKHSQAYKVLLNDESKRIARNLGLEAAHTAEICLDCHSDYVPQELRGDRFQLSDGVGCEACHGGAGTGIDANIHSGWLTPHISGASHQENIAAGLYPTEEPIARAELCLSCHFGNDDRFVDHRIMGAGHPRMSFELDTFTAIQPAHFVVDDDYRKRKQVWDSVKVWAIGQTMTVGSYLDAMVDPERGRDGLFPELVLFDCHACHHPMSQKFWQPHPERGLGPGKVRVNDANMLILHRILHRVDSSLGRRFSASVKSLHQATTRNQQAFLAAANELRGLLPAINDRVAQYQFGSPDMRKILDELIGDGMQGRFRDYAAAEQVAMAIGAILATLEKGDAAVEARMTAINDAMDKVYAALADDERYRPAQFASALKAVRSAIPN